MLCLNNTAIGILIKKKNSKIQTLNKFFLHCLVAKVMYLVQGFDVGHPGNILHGEVVLGDVLLDLGVGVGADLGLHLRSEEQLPQVSVALSDLGLCTKLLRLSVDVLRPSTRSGWSLCGPSNCPLLPVPLSVRSQMNLVPVK